MNDPGWKIATLRGVPVYIGRSWVFISIVIVAVFGPLVARSLPDLGVLAYAVAVAYVVGLLISVLVHEAAHALTGQARGFAVTQIVADLWGGHTAFSRESSRPFDSALVAGVGPLSNALLAVVAWAGLQLDLSDVPTLLLTAFMWANAFVALFNLLPGLPLDGGYLLEALVWGATGDRAKGTVAAGWVGRVLVLVVLALLVVLPLLRGERPDVVLVIWTAVIGAFLWFGAGAAVQRGRVTSQLSTVPLSSVLRPVGVADVSTAVSDLQPGDVVVLRGGEPVGLIGAGLTMQVPLELRPSTRADALVQVPDGPWLVRLSSEKEDVGDLVAHAGEHGLAERSVVLGPDGRVLGVVHQDELVAAVHRAVDGS